MVDINPIREYACEYLPMLVKPDISDTLLQGCLEDEYDLQPARVTFLPLGADVNAAVYRIDVVDKAYFLKLRKGVFSEITVTLPGFLNSQGIQAVIAPLKTRSKRLWSDLGVYKMVLYPFIEGVNGYEISLSKPQWHRFGAALKSLHTIPLPPTLLSQIPFESFSPIWREMVKQFQEQAKHFTSLDPIANRFTEFMCAKQSEIDSLIFQADRLGRILQNNLPELVLCHSDIHAGNVLLTPDDEVFIVDWDSPIFAPKEHDLAMVGGSTVWRSPRQVDLFYQGYGQGNINHTALAYYRCERIILDIADFCKQLILSTAGGEDREQSFKYFTSNFLPNHEVELALGTEVS